MAETVSVTAVERLRDKLIDRVFLARYRETLNGDALLDLARTLHGMLPQGIALDVLFESVRSLAGVELTPGLCKQVAWRLAGNIPRLREGRPATPWAGQQGDEWVPLQILSATPTRDHKGEIAQTYSFRVLAGSSAPMRTSAVWSHKFARFISRRIGFSAPWGDYPYQHPTMLVGLRLYGHVMAARSAQAPWFRDVSCPDSLQTWNRRTVLAYRLRRGKYPCPRGWSHPCHHCVVGYRECPAGTHRETYELGSCHFCGSEQKLFDPERSREKCLDCDKAERIERR